jgi:hypothetical protein
LSKEKEDLINHIESRLDEFFEEDGLPGNPSSAPTGKQGALEKLKSVVLSIDWEITDRCLSDLIDETEKLMPLYKDNRYVDAMLRMMQSLGRYIRKRKAQAHPDAIRRVMATFKGLERLTRDSEMTEQAKVHLVAKEIAAFKRLKEQVESKSALHRSSQRNETPGQQKSFVEQEHFEHAVGEMEKKLFQEVQMLKEQVAMLQKELKQLR